MHLLLRNRRHPDLFHTFDVVRVLFIGHIRLDDLAFAFFTEKLLINSNPALLRLGADDADTSAEDVLTAGLLAVGLLYACVFHRGNTTFSK